PGPRGRHQVGGPAWAAVGGGRGVVLAQQGDDAVGEEELRSGGTPAPAPAPGDPQDEDQQDGGRRQVGVAAPRHRVPAHARRRLDDDLVEAPQRLHRLVPDLGHAASFVAAWSTATCQLTGAALRVTWWLS